MKRTMMFVVMLVGMVICASAQYITKISPRDGYVYLSNGTALPYETVAAQLAAQGVSIGSLRPGETLQMGAARVATENYSREVERRGYNTPATYGGMYGGMYGGVMPVLGTSGSSFSIGNEHWGFSTSSSNFGGYKTSSTGLRIGSFQVGGSTSGFVGDSSYKAQKKADAKAAAARYSATRSTVSGNSNVNSTRANTTTTNTTSSKSDTIDDLFGGF